MIAINDFGYSKSNFINPLCQFQNRMGIIELKVESAGNNAVTLNGLHSSYTMLGRDPTVCMQKKENVSLRPLCAKRQWLSSESSPLDDSSSPSEA